MEERTNRVPTTEPCSGKKKCTKRLTVMLLIAAGVLVAGLAVFMLIFSGREYTVNTDRLPGETLKISSGRKSFSSANGEYSFLYPSTAEVSLEGENVYIYTVETGESPYVMVYLSKEKVTPDGYFKDYRRMAGRSLSNPKFGEISQVKIGSKTLYMLRAEIADNGSTEVIDRYIEIYPDMTVQYTVRSNHAGSEDKILSDIVNSLYLSASVYGDTQGTYTDTKSVSNDKIGVSMSFPADIQVSELPVGLFGSNDQMRVFASYQNTDAAGAAIYDADDFVNRISSVNGLLQNQLKVDQISIQNGTAEKVGNIEAYVFPITITDGDFSGSGKLYLTNSSNVGCYILYYALADDALTSSAEQCISSFEIHHAPQNISEYMLYTDGNKSFSFLYRTGVTDATPTDMGGIAELKLAEDAVFNIDTFMPSTEGVTSAAEYLAKFVETVKAANPDVAYTVQNADDAERGRLGFETIEITYVYDGSPRTVSLSCADAGSSIARVYYSAAGDRMKETLNTLRNDMLWSFRVY